MTGTDEPRPGQGPSMPPATFTAPQRKALTIVAVIATVLLFVVSGVILATRGDGGPDRGTTASSTTETTVGPTTTDATTTTDPAPASADIDPFDVAFPAPGGERRFDQARGAAQAYAAEILGFDDVDLGQLQTGDGRSGEITLSDGTDGAPVTTILLRQMADDTWFVLGSEAPDISVTSPTAGAALASPFQSTGTALAFEGTVDVVVRAQGSADQVGSGFVMGSGTPPAGPFDGRIFYAAPAPSTAGVLVYRTLSSEDGHVLQATSFRVRLTDRAAPQAPDECGNTAEDGDSVSAEAVRVVKVFFRCEPTGEIVALRRTIPAADQAILRATLGLLLAGPTDAEAAAGLTSVFPQPGGTLTSVSITDGVAKIDLSGTFADTVPSTSTSTGEFIEEVLRTATQYSSVTSVQLLFDGDCDAFAAWASADTCISDAR